MPKVILEFNLPEETEEYTAYMNGLALAFACEEFSNKLRAIVKYDDPEFTEEQRETIQKIRDMFYEYVGEFIV
jgi:hypothetical protein